MRGMSPRPWRHPSAAGVFVGVALGVSPFFGAYFKLGYWGTGALLVLITLAAATFAGAERPRGLSLLALGGLVGLWLWALASTTWAESEARAVVDADRWLLYAAVFAGLLLLVRDRRTMLVGLLAGIGAGGAIVVLFVVGRGLTGTGDDLFLAGRLHEPLGYANGMATFMLFLFWPIVELGLRVERTSWRAACAGAASLLASLLLLTQSRVVLPALALSAVALFVFARERERRFWLLVCVCSGVALASPALLELYDRSLANVLGARMVMLATGLALVGAGVAALLWSVGPRGFTELANLIGLPMSSRERVLRRFGALLVVLTVTGVLFAVGNPVGFVSRQVDAFVKLEGTAGQRFLSGGGYRYDYWRIAVADFTAEPWHGVGAGNYPASYFRERRTPEAATQPHSLELQMLGELGLPGLGFLLLFIVASLTTAVRAMRRVADDRELWLVNSCMAIVLVWVVHSAVDWLHLLPGITGIALAAAAGLFALSRPEGAVMAAGRARRLVAAGVAAAAAVVGTATLAPPLAGDYFRNQGRGIVAGDPAAALRSADRAIEFEGKNVQNHYLRAAALGRLGRLDEAIAALRTAQAKEPGNFVTYLLLGDYLARAGDSAGAQRAYLRAWLRNPLDPTVKRLAANPTAER